MAHDKKGRMEGKGGRKEKWVKGREGERQIERELSYVFCFYNSNPIMKITQLNLTQLAPKGLHLPIPSYWGLGI